MKKLLALALAMLMLTGAVNAPAAEAGETVTLEFTVLKDTGEIYAATVELMYDHEALELAPNRIFDSDKKIFIYGTLLRASFRIRENAAPGDYPVTLKILDASGPMGEAVLSPETALVFSEEYVTVERPPAEVPVYYIDEATGELLKAETMLLPVGGTSTVTAEAPEGWAVNGAQSIPVTVSGDGQAMPPTVTFWLIMPTPTPTPTATPTPAPTPTPAAPQPVTDLRVIEKDNRSVTLAWNGMENAGPYKVVYRMSGTNKWTSYDGNIVYDTKAEVRGLMPDKAYDFQVTALSGSFYGQGAVLSGQKTAARAYGGKNTSGDYVYALTDNGAAVITDYNGNGGEVTIPANIDGYPVISIGDRAFTDCISLNSVTIPDGVTVIGFGAFDSCSNLKSVTIPDSVTVIDEWAFSACDSLTSVTIPDSVIVIGDYSFYGCSGLTSVTIPDSVTGIGEQAFALCISLNSVTIPDSVTVIGNEAFYDCGSLTTVVISDGVTSIGRKAFKECRKLSSVTIPDSVTEIGDNPWASCDALKTINISPDHPSFSMIDGALYGKADNRLIRGPNTVTDSFAIRQGTRIIGDYALAGCGGLTSATIPDTVTYIGDYAFSSSQLTSLTIPDSVTYIGAGAFMYCHFQTSLTIPGNVKYIGDGAFGEGHGLVSVTLENGEIELGDNPWGGCPQLTTINVSPDHPTLFLSGGALYSKPDKRLVCVPCGMEGDLVIPRGVVTIDEEAAQGCDRLTSVTIPDSVTTIGNWAFAQCAGLTTVTIPDSVTTIGLGAFEQCAGLTTVTIPDGVTTIDNWAFYQCAGLTTVTIPDSVTCIRTGTFAQCAGLTTVTIPDGVTHIDSQAFEQCAGLTTVTIPDSVMYISDRAFYHCAGLTSVTIPAGVKIIGDGAFEDCPNLVLTVAKGSYAEEYCVSNGLRYRYAEGS